MVSFSEALGLFFRRYFDFQGRSSRSEYWWVQLFIWIVILGMAIIAGFMGLNADNPFETGSSPIVGILLVFGIIFILAIFIPSIALSVRRFHDLGQTGWFVLIFTIGNIIPVISWLFAIGQIAWFSLRGTVGPNRYGHDPLDPNADLGIFD